MSKIYRAYIIGAGLLMTLKGWAQTSRSEQSLKAEQYAYQAIQAEKQGDKRSALDLYEHAWHLDDRNAELAFALSKLYREQGQRAKADSLVERSYALDSTNVSVMIAYVSKLSSEQKNEQVISILERWLQHNPSDEIISQILAYVYTQGQQIDKAIKLYTKLREDNKSLYNEYAKYSLQIADLYSDSDRPTEARRELDHLLQAFPAEASIQLRVLDFLISKGYEAEVLPVLERLDKQGTVSQSDLYPFYLRYYTLIKDDANHERILTEILDEPRISGEQKVSDWMAFLTPKSEGGVISDSYNWVFDKIIAMHPDDTKAKLSYARILEAQQHRDKSIEILSALTKTMPENNEVWNLLFFQLMVQSRHKELIALNRQAVQYHPAEWRTVFFTSIAYYQEEQVQQAIHYLRAQIARLVPLSVEDYGLSKLWGQLGDLYDAVGDKKHSFQAYEESLTHDQDNAEVLNNYAYQLALEGKELEKAERLALRGLKVDKDNENLLDTYAWILYLKGQYSLADLYMRKAMEQAGEDISGTYYDHYGFVQWAQGNKDEARKLWQQALEKYRAEVSEATSSRSKKRKQEQIRTLEQAIKKLDR